MDALLYLGKVNLYWILFYACYWLIFRNHTFFRWNRAYLIGSLILAFFIPFIHFPDQVPVTATAVYAVSVIPIYVQSPESQPYFAHWTQFLVAVQIIGAFVMLSKFFEAFSDLIKLIKQGETIEFDEYTLVLLPHSEIGSFSFFKWLVINQNDYEEHFDPILRHESVHISQLHSFDILFIEVLKVVFWFNPVLWFYKKSIQEVHEFLADEKAVNRDHYARFLVSYNLSAPIASLTNHFFNSSLLKNRIQMIYKNRNSPWALGRYLTIVPMIILGLMLTAARERLLNAIERRNYHVVSGRNISIEGIVLNDEGNPVMAATIIDKGTEKGTSTDVNGRFKLDDIAIGSTLVITHVSYEAFEIEVNGTYALEPIKLRTKQNVFSEVVAEPTKKSEKDKSEGQVLEKSTGYQKTDLVPNLKNRYDMAVGAGSENRTIQKRTVAATPVAATPVVAGNIQVPNSSPYIVTRGWEGKPYNSLIKPLYIVDGEIDEDSTLLKKISPDDIQSISVLKGESAMNAYGFKGRNGVISIQTKKK